MLSEAQLSQQWNMIGFSAILCLYCHLFFFVVFETIDYLSWVSVYHVGYLKSCISLVATALVFVLGHYVSLFTCRFALLSFSRMLYKLCTDRLDPPSFV